VFVFSPGFGLNEENQIVEGPINVFDYLTDDAMRRRKDQELIELSSRQNRSLNLISENSAKILLKKVVSDFNSAIYQVSQLQEIGDTDSFILSEEQFASIFACMGFFRDLETE